MKSFIYSMRTENILKYLKYFKNVEKYVEYFKQLASSELLRI